MSVHAGALRFETHGDGDIIDLTEGVNRVVATSGVRAGVACVFAVGSTAAVTTMEHEPGGVADLQALLDRLVPVAAPGGGEYRHNVRNHDTNAHAHLRAAVVGPSESVPVVRGELGLGTWQQVVLLDFDDRPRDRVVSVSVLS
jgi:secondary thiamine-phosphate synthase enzyme